MPKVSTAWLSLESLTSDTSSRRHHIRGNRGWTRKMTMLSLTPPHSASSNGSHLIVIIHRWGRTKSPILHLGHRCRAHWTQTQTRFHQIQATKEVSSRSVGCVTLKAGGLLSKEFHQTRAMWIRSVMRKTVSTRVTMHTIWLLGRTYSTNSTLHTRTKIV